MRPACVFLRVFGAGSWFGVLSSRVPPVPPSWWLLVRPVLLAHFGAARAIGFWLHGYATHPTVTLLYLSHRPLVSINNARKVDILFHLLVHIEFTFVVK